ncbi:exodeoxyribonuclease VII large subunit [Helicobacter didelphidarum]|uniref:Exodeoxyribonuclease 7 large subunit n=1 Tax=Helicobacter didelphidarum TaxID=2040648 RepID=A0A3D8ICB6_9HELI|nr:exodeoxyribonuclease VII large subunit [Helicobacter didelphidarum]RDU62833.1 exodeoxyribonuclease VII large subunit [Helicobacter didelphidarum]
MQSYTQSPYHILEVSELTMQIKSILESDFSYVEVQGEVSGLTLHASGHTYFSLKDDYAVLSCTFFRNNMRQNPITLNNGDKIIAKGTLSVFPPRGTYSFNVTKCVYAGEGNLKAEYERLKKDLESRNYFIKQKPLPKFPKKIILLTSLTGAALQDMIKVASRRFCLCEFILIDTLTQGKEAKYSIAKNLQYADRLGADILVLARGGGSIEDLWNFNEIEVLESIYQCKTPVVSAIGHEIDYLLSDYVADVRAPTPSAAMEMILSDKESLIMQLFDLETMLGQFFERFLRQKAEVLRMQKYDIEILNPLKRIELYKQLLHNNENTLRDCIKFFIHKKRQQTIECNTYLESLNPTQRIVDYHNVLESLEQSLRENVEKKLQTKNIILQTLKSSLDTYFHFFLAKKRNTLLLSLDSSIAVFLQQKSVILQNITQIITQINPANRLESGFVQILKNNKPVQIKDLKSKDRVELVDVSGSIQADIV